MSRPREFNVIFDNKLGIFRNGQKMTGAVLIETDEPLDFEGKDLRPCETGKLILSIRLNEIIITIIFVIRISKNNCN